MSFLVPLKRSPRPSFSPCPWGHSSPLFKFSLPSDLDPLLLLWTGIATFPHLFLLSILLAHLFFVVPRPTPSSSAARFPSHHLLLQTCQILLLVSLPHVKKCIYHSYLFRSFPWHRSEGPFFSCRFGPLYPPSTPFFSIIPSSILMPNKTLRNAFRSATAIFPQGRLM